MKGLVGLATLAIIMFAGCNRAGPYAAAVKDRIQAEKELGKILRTVKDGKTMTAAGSEIRKRYRRFEELARRFKALGRPPEDVARQLNEELGPQILLAHDILLEEISRVEALPGGKEFFQKIKKLK